MFPCLSLASLLQFKSISSIFLFHTRLSVDLVIFYSLNTIRLFQLILFCYRKFASASLWSFFFFFFGTDFANIFVHPVLSLSVLKGSLWGGYIGRALSLIAFCTFDGLSPAVYLVPHGPVPIRPEW